MRKFSGGGGGGVQNVLEVPKQSASIGVPDEATHHNQDDEVCVQENFRDSVANSTKTTTPQVGNLWDEEL